MLGLCNLKTNLEVVAAIWIVFPYKFLDSKSIQDVLVVFGLMVGTELVTHDYGASSFVG